MARRINETKSGGLRRIMKNLSRAVSSGYSYCRQWLSVLIRQVALLIKQISKTIWGWLSQLGKTLSRARSKGYPYYRHPVAYTHHALEQCRFAGHTPDERSQYFQCPSGALLGQVVLPRRSPHIGGAGQRKR